MCSLCGVVAFSIVSQSSLSAQTLPEVLLATNGKARMPVVVGPDATPDVREAAAELGEYFLLKMEMLGLVSLQDKKAL
jgi:hypothetical protein